MKMISLFLTAAFLSTASFAQIKLNRPVAVTPAAGNACCGFRAYNSAELPMAANFGKENTIVFDKEVFDDANAFNGAAFKAPSDGVYQFNLQLGLKATNTDADMNQVMIKIKAATQSSTQLLNIPAKYDNVITTETNALFKLKAGEEVSIVLVSLGNVKPVTTGNLSYFSGIKLY